MTARRAVQDRDPEDAEILEALVQRGEEGMTVLELRGSVTADIDTIETSLTELKREGLIEIDQQDDSPVIIPDETVMPANEETAGEETVLDSIEEVFERLRDRFPF